MKKIFTLLIFLFATAFHSIAQDTITGVVNRVAAPYFEQNVCDTRFAITIDSETYYVMVDNYWPNPYLEDLVIHYDTIAIGNEIEVVGEIKEMEDGTGEAFSVIDIQELINATYSYGTGFIDWANHYAVVICNVPPFSVCYITINGELQTEYPIVFNGMTLENERYTMIGIADTWPGYNLPILELTQVIPYSIETTATGIIVANDELCLTMPCAEKKYLSWADDNGYHYITNNDRLLEDGFYSAIWGNDINSTIKGFENTHYDIYGVSFSTFEIIELETEAERNIFGQIRTATEPPIGPYPAITQRLAIIFDEYTYYIDNPHNWNANNCFIGNDTVPMYGEVTAVFSTSSLFLGENIPTPYFNIHIDRIESILSLTEDYMTNSLTIHPNPSDGIINIHSEETMKIVYVYDSMGQIIFNKTFCSNNITLDLSDYKGLVLLYIVFQDGHKTIKKEIIK